MTASQSGGRNFGRMSGLAWSGGEHFLVRGERAPTRISDVVRRDRGERRCSVQCRRSDAEALQLRCNSPDERRRLICALDAREPRRGRALPAHALQIAVKCSDIYNGRLVPFVPFNKLDGDVVEGTHMQR